MKHPLSTYRALSDQTMEAFAATIGVTKATISKWEAGVAMPRKAQIEKIVAVTGGCVTSLDLWNFYYDWGQ
ncbi:helix-turn-helix transcriptional regulator [Pseudochrobactrum lubricantis]|uniref:helix-turn-helix transcriptional regulator n=1 Tax=Pseudochrobactrum lubricantis TaxID=558172 RepID=UPI0035DB96DE